MVHDPSLHPEPGPFPAASTIDRLQRAVARYLSDPLAEDDVRAAFRVFALEARAKRLRAEELVIMFKKLWVTFPEVQAIAERGERQRLLDRLVTVCIQQYYE